MHSDAMFKLSHPLLMAAVAAILSACAHIDKNDAADKTDIETEGAAVTLTGISEDGVKFYGDYTHGSLDNSAPLIMLFHQGGSNGRAEFAPLIPWLNDLGYRTIAWDQRTGGGLYGGENRTLAGHPETEDMLLPENREARYCDAYLDFKGALDLVLEQGLSEKPIVWGGSYAGALAFQLAAEYPDNVSGLLGFSPSSGEWMAKCRTRKWVDEIKVPTIVFRPESEASSDNSVAQRAILEAAGIEFHVVANGVHASSLLVDDRTEHDMGATRALVEEFLAEVSN